MTAKAGVGLRAGPGDESTLEAGALERLVETSALSQRLPGAWFGGRLRVLVILVVLLCTGLVLMLRTLAALPYVDSRWTASTDGRAVLAAAADPELASQRGRTLVASPALLHRSLRWQTDDTLRAEQLARAGAPKANGATRLLLQFDNGEEVVVTAGPRGLAGIGWLFWPLLALALLLALLGAVVLLAMPNPRHALYATMCTAQAGNLLFVAIGSMPGLPLPVLPFEMPLRTAFDAATAAAAVHALALHPFRLPHARTIAVAAWSVAALLVIGALLPSWGGVWVRTQAGLTLLGAGAVTVAALSHRARPHPLALLLRRLAAALLGVWILVSLTIGVAASLPEAAAATAAVASALWTLFIAALLMVLPFVSRSRGLLREFALLAGISTVATSLDLLFAALFSLGPFASLTLAVFLALGVYAGVRQWLLDQVTASHVLTTERTFERIYRLAREVQAQPALFPERARLLRELFDPLEVLPLAQALTRSRVVAGGSVLAVPIESTSAAPPSALVLRFAQRGRRLFNADDARLADRIVEQLRRALAWDQAVERGRSEERLRIAQDLHDDIGARLLTLMYQARTPEMEDYIRHTLQDLKTLTRGLAAAEHRLSHAAGEWKADLAQRAAAARVQLDWAADFDADPNLSVVQWSSLTRVLRELVSNAIAHARASRIEVRLGLARGELLLAVCDDGGGHAPHAWSQGLGLGGVKKRVRQLGGRVAWAERQPRGIRCEVRVPNLMDEPRGRALPGPPPEGFELTGQAGSTRAQN